MVDDSDPNSQIAKPDEMLSEERRKQMERNPVKPLLNGVWIDKLVDGQDLTVGGSFIDSNAEVKLNLDFSVFEPKLASLNPEALRARFDQNRENLEAWLKSAEKTTGRKINIDPYLFYCLQQVQGNVLALLNHDPKSPPSGLDRHQVYQQPNPKLSGLVGKSHCAEMAALGQYALQKVGIDSVYVGGVTMHDASNQDEYAEAHSFIVINDGEGHGKYIFDIARPGQHNLPTVLKPGVSVDYESLQGDDEKLITAEEILLGGKRYFGVGEQVAGRHNIIG